jgi:hypothetical protein
MSLDGTYLSEHQNPYTDNYGPRCLATDDEGLLFQTCTTFPTSGGALTECYVISIPVTNLEKEQDRLPLNGPSGLINARAIEYDRSDENFWIGDFGGNIYKITGFNFVPPPITSVEPSEMLRGGLTAAPNPASTSSLISLGATTVDRKVTLIVVDLFGREVVTLFNGMQGAGVDLTTRWSTSQIPNGAYRIVASTSGNIIASASLIITH